MNPYHETSPVDSPRDPLDHLIEAFVDQSVPLGPDEARQRRLIAAMRAMDPGIPLKPARPELRLIESDVETSRRRWGRRFSIAARTAIGLAAAILVVVALALRSVNHDPADAPAPQTAQELIASAPSIDAPPSESHVLRLIDKYLRASGKQEPSREALKAMFAAVLRDHPQLAASEPWRNAQQRLTAALDQPGVISVGMGLLGTLPWATRGRF